MLHLLIQNLHFLANPTQAAPMAAYLRDQFPLLGIKTPARETVVKAWLKEQPPAADEQLLDWVQELYALPEREFQYVACDLLKAKGKKLDPHFWLPHLATFITTKSWWDTVDVWAPKIGAGLLLRAPELRSTYPDQWITSNNFWLQRSALIYQLNYRKQMEVARLFSYCRKTMHNQEFFVQKGMGWALRAASRHFPEEVIQFLAKEQSNLSALSFREGSKLLKKNGQWPV